MGSAMSESSQRRPGRKSAGAALLASILAHVGLLLLGLWSIPIQQPQQHRPTLKDSELIIFVDADERGKGHRAGQDVSLSAPEPTTSAVKHSRVVDDAPVPPSDHGSERGPSVRGSFDHAGGATEPTGNGTSFFPVSATARTVVYVLDRSMSMGVHDGLRQARAELLASLSRLTPPTQFQIIAYNMIAEPLAVHNYGGMLSPDGDTLAEVTRLLAALRPIGRTNHLQALLRGLELRPDVLFLATDGDELTPDEVAAVLRYNGGRCSIHVIDFSDRPADVGGPLRLLAEQNRGTYRRVAVKAL